ncbi:VOC family protein [Salinigranum sp. GCM10025319]|jgi:lactoylglutathione lyase|uniref:VOC family protein n=1 Tax=Salinigranum sp. GCM10025319 TaxID=3252687 RepID=UPI0036151C2A
MELIHTCLNVSDVDRAVEFYTEELGFEESWSFESADGRTENRYVACDAGVELQLSETEGETDLEAGSLWDHVAVKVDDVDAAFDRIDNHGVIKEPADQPPAGARTAMIEDPDGHIVELVQPL